MELILNDYSLNGQFENTDDFIDDLYVNIIPCLYFAEQENYVLLKSYTSYNSQVTKNQKLNEIIRESKGSAEIQRFKSFLSQLAFTEPYWDDDKKTPKNIKASCLTECYFRSGILLSFCHDDYSNKEIYVSINNNKSILLNAHSKKMLLENLHKLGVYNLNNSFIIPVKNLKIEIRTSEPHHNEPHIHITNKSTGTEVSILLKDFTIKVGGFKKDDKDFFYEWLNSNNNKIHLKELWNYYHEDKPVK